MSSQGDETPCTLLLNIGGQVVDVAKAVLMNPLDRELHHVRMPDTVFKVTLSRLVSNEYSKLPLPVPSGGEEQPTDLGGSKGWMIMWPKVLIRVEPAGATPTQVTPLLLHLCSSHPLAWAIMAADVKEVQQSRWLIMPPTWIHHLITWRM